MPRGLHEGLCHAFLVGVGVVAAVVVYALFSFSLCYCSKQLTWN